MYPKLTQHPNTNQKVKHLSRQLALHPLLQISPDPVARHRRQEPFRRNCIFADISGRHPTKSLKSSLMIIVMSKQDVLLDRIAQDEGALVVVRNGTSHDDRTLIAMEFSH